MKHKHVCIEYGGFNGNEKYLPLDFDVCESTFLGEKGYCFTVKVCWKFCPDRLIVFS